MRTIATLAVVALTAAGLTAVAQPASAAASAAGAYVPVAQKRVVDTRVGVGAPKGAIPAQKGGKATLAGVPASAVAVQVTATAASSAAAGGLTLWKPGTSRPGVNSLLFGAGQTATTTVLVRVLNSQVDYFNAAGSSSVQMVLDITGYYLGGTALGSPGILHTITPVRVINTGAKLGAVGPVGAGKTISTVVTGTGHPLPTGTGQVVATISVTSPTKGGSLIVYGGTRPVTQTLDFNAGSRLSGFAIVPLSSAGAINVFNNSTGTVQIAVDIVGYFFSSAPTTVAGSLQPLQPARVFSKAVGANSTTAVPIGGKGGVPLSASLVSAVLVGVQVTSPSVAGSMIVYPGGTTPGVRHLSWAPHTSAVNIVLVPVSSAGTISLLTSSAAATTVSVDVYGYVGATNVTAPVTSPSRYVRNISDSDITAMNAEGAADAAAGAKLVILEFGAQKSDQSGVQLTGPAGTPLTYGNVQAAVQSYLSGFGAHAGVTVAVGTNNDGPGPNNTGWQIFPAASRGARWAQLVDAITPPTGVSVVGADDIESGFFSTEAQAEAWESGYIGATTKTLIFNGSADGCPFTFGGTTACTFGWTLLNYNHLAHSGSRIQAVPQIYNAQQAVQWANIDAVSGGAPITFAGVLTEHATDPSTFTPAQGFAAAFHALSAVVASPSLPAVTDIQVNG